MAGRRISDCSGRLPRCALCTPNGCTGRALFLFLLPCSAGLLSQLLLFFRCCMALLFLCALCVSALSFLPVFLLHPSPTHSDSATPATLPAKPPRHHQFPLSRPFHPPPPNPPHPAPKTNSSPPHAALCTTRNPAHAPHTAPHASHAPESSRPAPPKSVPPAGS